MADPRASSAPGKRKIKKPPKSGKPSISMAEQYQRAEAKRVRSLITPEGVDLKLKLANAGERAGAYIIDLSIMLITLIAMTIGSIFLLSPFSDTAGRQAVTIIWLLFFFCLRNFYFIAFELGPRAATPGKRIAGLRVASRNGGRLTAEAVFARNALREIEIFLPLSFSAPGIGVDAWISLIGMTWSLIFLLFPLFNKDRLRAGDLIAGTWVVKAPKHQLSVDLAAHGEEKLAAGMQFNREELNAYGVHELHVLERILRENRRENIIKVAAQIRKKLGRPQDAGFTDRDFLWAYYAALRQHLEGRLAMGVRRKDKHDAV